ncbi:hypothetical protein EV363DRAFT_1325015 [Boletus edulis]|nr:hypothetical protein EV363DRAFT_1325015 [Boletus edulis]
MRKLYFGDELDGGEYNGKLYGLGQTFSAPAAAGASYVYTSLTRHGRYLYTPASSRVLSAGLLPPPLVNVQIDAPSDSGSTPALMPF